MIDQGKQIPMFVGLAAFQLFFLLLISVTSHYHQFGGSISPFCILSLKLLKPSFFLGLSSHFPSFSIMFPSFSQLNFQHLPIFPQPFPRRSLRLRSLRLLGGGRDHRCLRWRRSFRALPRGLAGTLPEMWMVEEIRSTTEFGWLKHLETL